MFIFHAVFRKKQDRVVFSPLCSGIKANGVDIRHKTRENYTESGEESILTLDRECLNTT